MRFAPPSKSLYSGSAVPESASGSDRQYLLKLWCQLFYIIKLLLIIEIIIKRESAKIVKKKKKKIGRRPKKKNKLLSTTFNLF